MLLLIGGAPGIGKSAVAMEIARELGLLRQVDLDVLRDILRIQSREQDDPMLFRNALNAFELHGSYAPSTVIAGFQAHIRPLAGATGRLLDSYLSTNKSAIVHGLPLLPAQFARYRSRGAQFAILGAKDEETYRKRLGERGRARQGRSPAEDRLGAGWIIHQYLVKEANEAGIPVIVEDTPEASAAAFLRKFRS